MTEAGENFSISTIVLIPANKISSGDSEGHINDTQKDETSPAPLRKPEARSEEAADRSDLSLATWLGVKKKHLRTQILDFYNMPWTDDVSFFVHSFGKQHFH